MRFLCDVHISYKVCRFLIARGHEAFYVNQLEAGSNTSDSTICRYADENDLVVLTKDADFVDFYFIKRSPKKVIKVTLGNVATSELIDLLADVLPMAQTVAHREHFLIEVHRDGTYTVDQTENKE